jgi:heat-inducible transcriptional repressor
MLTERQRAILQAIVENYIRSAEPVGSRTIAKYSDISYSSATIRNEMADLEEMGYLEQPHTSAGRIPSQKGYRYYVDHLIQLEKIEVEQMQRFKDLFQQRYFQIDQSIRQSALILSELTNYTSFILGPEIFHTHLRQIQIVTINENTAVAILVTDTGKVENRLVTIPEGVAIDQIEKMVNIINHRLRGTPLSNLQSRIMSELADEMRKNLEQYEESMKILQEILVPHQEERLFLGGKTQILSQPEFKDVDKVKDLLQLLDQNETLYHLVNPSTKGISVKIGTENNNKVMNQCSIISASYEIEGKVVGSIGILGPIRMDYGRIIGMLDILSRDLSTILSRLYK